MQILLSCAKDMATKPITFPNQRANEPHFIAAAKEIAAEMMNFSTEELEEILKINSKLANQNWLRYQHFLQAGDTSHAALAFTGMAYKHLKASSFNQEDIYFANQHLWITSFLYGLLRPLDAIKPHRLEGYVRLQNHDDIRLFDYWKPRLTQHFIQSISNDNGMLAYLASEEMKSLFDWNEVKKKVKIFEPQFMVENARGRKTIVVYTKMCRGAMANYIIKNKITNTDDLLAFEYEGFKFAEWIDNGKTPLFVLGAP